MRVPVLLGTARNKRVRWAGHGTGNARFDRAKLEYTLTKTCSDELFLHQLDKPFKQILRIVRAGSGFGVILYAEYGKRFVTKTGDGFVI